MSASAHGRAPTPSAGPAVGRPFSLKMIHFDLWHIREDIARIVSTGDKRSADRAANTLANIETLITRISIEHAMGKVIR